MSFARKIPVAVSMCYVCERGGEIKQRVNLCDSAESELNNSDRLILPTNVTERL